MITWRARAYKPRESTPQPHTGHHWASREHAGALKGVLHREKLGRAWQYRPVEAREDHDARLMAEALRSGGDEDVTMRRFVERVNDEEMESLCIALADARSQRRLTVA